VTLIDVIRIVVALELLGTVSILVAVALSAPLRKLRERRAARAVEELLAGGAAGEDSAGLVAMAQLQRRHLWVRGQEPEKLADLAARSGWYERLIRLLGDRRGWVRAEAAYLLPVLRVKEVASALAAALGDPDLDVRLAAGRGLVETLRLMPSLTASEEGSVALRRLVDALDPPGEIPSPHLATMLAALSLVAVPALLEALPRLKPRGKAAAASVLGEIKDIRAVGGLIALLRDESLDVRCRSAAALGLIGDPRAREPLVDLCADPDWQVRSQAAKALGMLGDPRACGALRGLLGDAAWWVRVNAARALVSLGPAGIAALQEALEDPDPYARERAIVELEEAGALPRSIQDRGPA
jgi:HEAT repeat protein